MLLTIFVLAQLIFDAGVLLLVLLVLVRRRSAPTAPPPDWYPQFLGLAQDLIAATDPVLDVLESRGPAAAASTAVERDGPGPATGRPAEHRHRRAAELLRAGVRPEEVARRGRLLPGELRLIRNVVAAQAATNPPRGA